MVQKICLFLQKETSHCKNSLAFGPQGSKQYIFGDQFYSRNAKKLRLHVFLLFHVRKHMTSSFYLKLTEFIRSFEFCPNWWYHIFFSIKIEEYMGAELSGIFWGKMVAKNIAFGSPVTHFMLVRVNKIAGLRPATLLKKLLFY